MQFRILAGFNGASRGAVARARGPEQCKPLLSVDPSAPLALSSKSGAARGTSGVAVDEQPLPVQIGQITVPMSRRPEPRPLPAMGKVLRWKIDKAHATAGNLQRRGFAASAQALCAAGHLESIACKVSAALFGRSCRPSTLAPTARDSRPVSRCGKAVTMCKRRRALRCPCPLHAGRVNRNGNRQHYASPVSHSHQRRFIVMGAVIQH